MDMDGVAGRVPAHRNLCLSWLCHRLANPVRRWSRVSPIYSHDASVLASGACSGPMTRSRRTYPVPDSAIPMRWIIQLSNTSTCRNEAAIRTRPRTHPQLPCARLLPAFPVPGNRGRDMQSSARLRYQTIKRRTDHLPDVWPLSVLGKSESNPGIAARFMGPRMVITHVFHILGKLGAGTRATAVNSALRPGIVWISNDAFAK